MKKLQNSLYILTQGAYLAKEGETIAVYVDKELKQRFPIHNQSNILCFGNVLCTPALMGMCGEYGVGMSFFTENGRFLARVNGPISGNVLLRRKQYRTADDANSRAELARWMVIAKIANGRKNLIRAAREYPGKDGAGRLKEAASYLFTALKSLESFKPLDTVRGIEGDAARVYFSVFDELIVAQKDNFFFHGRNRRPPMDNVNAMLSFVYTLLAHDVASALEGVGLDPAVGFLHADRPGRPSLALDLIEEFRSMISDRLVLTLINRKQVRKEGFLKTETGGVIMDDKTRKEIIKNYQERKRDEIKHPFISEKIPLGLLPHVQAMLMSSYLRGDIDGYPPFYWK